MSAETVFITGATSGIGAELARAFHARGATVIASGRDPAALARLAAACPGVETEVLDVRDAAAVARCAAAVGGRHAGLSTVISNAGVQRLLDFAGVAPPDAAALADLDDEVDANLKGVLYVARAFAPLLRRVAEYVDAHLTGDVSLAAMAATVGLSPFHFARQFRDAVGVPPHQYVLQQRVERAKALLRAGRLPLTDVALLAGFADQSHLTRVFRRAVGTTPGQFRRTA